MTKTHFTNNSSNKHAFLYKYSLLNVLPFGAQIEQKVLEISTFCYEVFKWGSAYTCP